MRSFRFYVIFLVLRTHTVRHSRFSSDDLAADGRLHCDLKHLSRDRVLQSLTYGFSRTVRFLSEHKDKSELASLFSSDHTTNREDVECSKQPNGLFYKDILTFKAIKDILR